MTMLGWWGGGGAGKSQREHPLCYLSAPRHGRAHSRMNEGEMGTTVVVLAIKLIAIRMHRLSGSSTEHPLKIAFSKQPP